MLTFEKVLEIFKDYLALDTELGKDFPNPLP